LVLCIDRMVKVKCRNYKDKNPNAYKECIENKQEVAQMNRKDKEDKENKENKNKTVNNANQKAPDNSVLEEVVFKDGDFVKAKRPGSIQGGPVPTIVPSSEAKQKEGRKNRKRVKRSVGLVEREKSQGNPVNKLQK
jgi:type IV secretory pathway VirB9-like protein